MGLSIVLVKQEKYSETAELLADRVGELRDHLEPLAGCGLPPGLEGRAGGLDGVGGIGGITRRHFGDDLTRCRVEHLVDRRGRDRRRQR